MTAEALHTSQNARSEPTRDKHIISRDVAAVKSWLENEETRNKPKDETQGYKDKGQKKKGGDETVQEMRRRSQSIDGQETGNVPQPQSNRYTKVSWHRKIQIKKNGNKNKWLPLDRPYDCKVLVNGLFNHLKMSSVPLVNQNSHTEAFTSLFFSTTEKRNVITNDNQNTVCSKPKSGELWS